MSLLVTLPSLSVIGALVLAKMHGRSGHFPAVIQTEPAPTTPPQCEVAEIVNLQTIQEVARGRGRRSKEAEASHGKARTLMDSSSVTGEITIFDLDPW